MQVQAAPHNTAGFERRGRSQVAAQLWLPQWIAALRQALSWLTQVVAHGPEPQNCWSSRQESVPAQVTVQAKSSGQLMTAWLQPRAVHKTSQL